MSKILIIGGGYAGLLTALRLKGEDVTVINRSDTFVERIRLHQVAAGQQLKRRSIPKLLKRVKFIQGEVTALDPEQRRVVVNGQTLDYDYLVYALGSMIDTSNVPGVEEYAYTLDNLSNLPRTGKRLVICGGGLTGIETTTELAGRYEQVQIITQEACGAQLSPKGREYLQKVFNRKGIDVRDHSKITHITQNAVHLQDGSTIPFDVCLWSASFTVPGLARESSLEVNTRGQMIVDPYLRAVNHPEIYVAGDAAYVPGIRMACATAMPMGAHVADNLKRELQGELPQPFNFSYLIRCISLGRRDGLIQRVYADDRPMDKIITGWRGALVKEFICRFTIWSLQLEKRFPGMYSWPKKPQVEQETQYGVI